MKESYRFSLVLCRHNSDLLSNSAIVIGQNWLRGEGVLDEDALKIKATSDNLLLLVTPAFIFATKLEAQAFGQGLSEYLHASVHPAISLGDWLKQYWDEPLPQFLCQQYNLIRAQAEANFEPVNWDMTLEYPSIATIIGQANECNSADPIANYWCRQTDYDSKDLCQQTILVPCEQAQLISRHNQMFTPMSVEGYGHDMIANKYPEAQHRLMAIIDGRIMTDAALSHLSWAGVADWLSTWCWHHIVLMALEHTSFTWGKSSGLTDSGRERISAIIAMMQSRQAIEAASKAQIAIAANQACVDFSVLANDDRLNQQQLAVSYLSIDKIVSSAVAQLSSPPGMTVNECVQTTSEAIWQGEQGARQPLTGAWFSGGIGDMAKLHPKNCTELAKALNVMTKEVWHSILCLHWYLVAEICGYYHHKIPIDYYRLNHKNLLALAEKLANVSGDTAQTLRGGHAIDNAMDSEINSELALIASTALLPRNTAVYWVNETDI